MNGSLVNSSDARLKKEIHDIDYGLATALKLRPVSFQWKRENDAKTHLGLIAQEVEKVVPEVVARQAGPDGIESLTVNYLELVPVLMKAVQEQNKLLVEQDGRIKKLENDRSRWTLASVFEGSALVGLLPLGLVLGLRRRRAERHAD
jgi:hypothetical protein